MGSTNDKNTQNEKNVVLEIEDLQLSFGENEVLKGFNLKLYEGEKLAVMGRSGSGKSVLIKCVVGLIEPDNGRMEVLGKDISNLDQAKMDDLRADIGFLFQGSALYDSMTVRENLEFPLRRHTEKFDQNKTEKMVQEALEHVDLEKAIDLMPAELSGGMARRIALARALILEPKIIFYDEPTTGLDPITAKEITNLMNDVQKKFNASSLIITHDVDCVRRFADRIILLLDGKNYVEGTFEELSSSEDPKANSFFK